MGDIDAVQDAAFIAAEECVPTSKSRRSCTFGAVSQDLGHAATPPRCGSACRESQLVVYMYSCNEAYSYLSLLYHSCEIQRAVEPNTLQHVLGYSIP